MHTNWQPDEREASRLRLLYTYQSAITALVGMVVIAGFLLPERFEAFVWEGDLIQNLSFVLHALAVAVALVAGTLHLWHLGRGYWLIPLLGLIGFLEELGWGTRFIVDPSVPVVLGQSLDSVASLMRIVWLTWSGPMGLGVEHLAFLGLAVLVAVRPWVLSHARDVRDAVDQNPSLTYVLLALVLMSGAWVLHTVTRVDHPVMRLEELLELCSAVTLLFGALSGPVACPLYRPVPGLDLPIDPATPVGEGTLANLLPGLLEEPVVVSALPSDELHPAKSDVAVPSHVDAMPLLPRRRSALPPAPTARQDSSVDASSAVVISGPPRSETVARSSTR